METGIAALTGYEFWVAFFAVIGFITVVYIVTSYVIAKVTQVTGWIKRRHHEGIERLSAAERARK